MVQEPIIEGHEFSAWVVGLGENVEGLAIGQLVAADPAISCGVCEFCQEGNPNVCPDV
jgi:threonine dehydrogenase-like Zn-dependent dehydrogenase